MAKAIILRLESYLMYLTQLKSAGKTTTTSEELAKLFGISSSRVRQDMVSLGFVGKPRSGYSIAGLEQTITEALDVDNLKGIALVGLGNLGRALAESQIWGPGGFVLKAVFDNDPSVIGTSVRDIKVRGIGELLGVVRSEGIEAACIAVPSRAAQQVADVLVMAGVRAIWNFAPVEISVPAHIIVENQHLSQGLMTLSFRMKSG